MDNLGNAIALMAAKDLSKTGNEILRRAFGPPADELGLALKQIVGDWRTRNLGTQAIQAQEMNPEMGQTQFAHHRILNEFIEKGSWVDDPVLSKAWAGLLASSCTEDRMDQSNLNYTNLLGQLTCVQARIIDFACTKFTDRLIWGRGLLIEIRNVQIPSEELVEACGESDPSQLDVELDRLNTLGLVNGGFFRTSRHVVNFAPTHLCVNLYVRCQGSRKTAYEFFHEHSGEVE